MVLVWKGRELRKLSFKDLASSEGGVRIVNEGEELRGKV